MVQAIVNSNFIINCFKVADLIQKQVLIFL
jgi:hypothetical protein